MIHSIDRPNEDGTPSCPRGLLHIVETAHITSSAKQQRHAIHTATRDDTPVDGMRVISKDSTKRGKLASSCRAFRIVQFVETSHISRPVSLNLEPLIQWLQVALRITEPQSRASSGPHRRALTVLSFCGNVGKGSSAISHEKFPT